MELYLIPAEMKSQKLPDLSMASLKGPLGDH